MILGLGIDIIDKERVAKVYKKFDEIFVRRILSLEEIERFNSFNILSKKVHFLAKSFSVKESFVKAIGIGMGRGIFFPDITLKNDAAGKPEIFLNSIAKKFITNYYNGMDVEKIKFIVSTSDEKCLINTAVLIDYDKTV